MSAASLLSERGRCGVPARARVTRPGEREVGRWTLIAVRMSLGPAGVCACAWAWTKELGYFFRTLSWSSRFISSSSLPLNLTLYGTTCAPFIYNFVLAQRGNATLWRHVRERLVQLPVEDLVKQQGRVQVAALLPHYVVGPLTQPFALRGDE